MTDRAVHFLPDIGRDELLDDTGPDQKIDFKASRRRRDDGEVLFSFADDLADDRHRVIVGAEPSDSDSLAVFDQANRVFDRFNDLFSLLAHLNPRFCTLRVKILEWCSNRRRSPVRAAARLGFAP